MQGSWQAPPELCLLQAGSVQRSTTKVSYLRISLATLSGVILIHWLKWILSTE